MQEEELLSEGGFGFVYRVGSAAGEKYAMKKLILSVSQGI